MEFTINEWVCERDFDNVLELIKSFKLISEEIINESRRNKIQSG